MKKSNRVKEIIIRRSSLIITFILILGAFGLLRVVTTHKDIDDVANIDLPLIEILTQIETNQLEQAINFERALKYAQGMENSLQQQRDFSRADSTFRYLAQIVDLDLIEAERQVTQALKSTQQQSQQIKLKGLLLSVKKLESDHTSYENHAISVLKLLEKGQAEAAALEANNVEQEEDQFNKQIEGVLMRHEMFTEALVQIVEQEEVLSMKWIVTLTLLFIILSLLAVYTFSYRIWRPLEDIRTGAEKIGGGDFETRIKLKSNSITTDIVEAFNEMADKLEASQKEIDRFIHFSYSTANDLKAPIKNVQSLLNMLNQEEMPKGNFDAVLNNARRTAEQLDKTVSSLAEVNRVREELAAELEILSIDEVLKEVVSNYVSEIKAASASIKKDFSECATITYPKTHLRRIFEVLLSNALKYRDPEKPLLIKIKAREINNHITLIFKDNGLGFDAIKYQSELMKPYVRLHSHVDGAGLGLYIVKTILDFHKGGHRIESEPKQGATFALRLN